MSKRTLEEKCLAKYETAWRTALTMADNDKTVAVGIFQAITKAEVFKKSWSEAPGSGLTQRGGRRNRWTDLTEITSCFKNITK